MSSLMDMGCKVFKNGYFISMSCDEFFKNFFRKSEGISSTSHKSLGEVVKNCATEADILPSVETQRGLPWPFH